MPISTKKRDDAALGEPSIESAASLAAKHEDKLTLEYMTPAELTRAYGFLPAGDIEPEPIKWLWYPYIPAGMLSTVEGDPGVGKSWLTCMMATCISRGWALPGGTEQPPAHAFMMSGEDSLPHVMIPRLKMLGADMSRIGFPRETFAFTPETLRFLSDFLRKISMAVVFVDPVQHYMGGDRDMNKANEVREFLGGLNTIAMISGCAVVIVRHLRKAGGSNKIYRGLGSIDFTAAARSSLHVTRSPHDDTAIIEHVKCNIGKLGPPMGYRILGNPDPTSFEWVDGVVPIEPKAKKIKGDNTKAICEAFLIAQLKDGPKLAKEVLQCAVEASIPEASLLKHKLQVVKAVKVGAGWQWELKEQTGGE